MLSVMAFEPKPANIPAKTQDEDQVKSCIHRLLPAEQDMVERQSSSKSECTCNVGGLRQAGQTCQMPGFMNQILADTIFSGNQSLVCCVKYFLTGEYSLPLRQDLTTLLRNPGYRSAK
jgi:hypothetical protein